MPKRRWLAPTLALSTLLVVALFAGVALRHEGARSRKVEGLRRMETRPSQYWFEQRSFPTGTIPVAAYEAAFAQARSDLSRMRRTLDAGLPTWEFAGPDNIGGRITAMAVGPGGSPIYVASANGGVFKSTDNGVTFLPIFDEFSTFSIGALALDPTDPNTIYVGTGEANPAIDTYDGNGIYRSTNGGTTWTHLGPSNVKRFNRIVIDPSNTQRILAAGAGSIFTLNNDHGIWRSEDGGTNWTQVLFVDNVTYGADIAMNPAHPESLFCSMWDFGASPTTESAIYRSIDSGTNWTRLGVAEGLPASNDSTDRITIAYAPSRPSTLYAQIIGGAAMGYVGRGLYRSVNGGANWLRMDSGTTFRNNFGGFGWYFGTMGVDPLLPDRIYAMGVGLLRSTTGGVSWLSNTGAAHVDQHAIWIDPTNSNRIFLGNDGGFFRTTNGSTWVKGGAQPFSQFYAITVDPTDVLRRVGGTQDNNTLLTTGSPSGWFSILGGDGFYCVVDPVSPSIVFAESQNMTNGTGPRRGGVAPTGFSPSDRYNWNSPFVMDPSDHNVLLAGSHRIYKSTDNGQTYAPVSGDLAFNPSSSRPSGTLSTISISPVAPLVYYTGSSNGKVYRSIDGGANWVDKTAGLPLRYVTRVTADQFDPNTVYCSLSGFNGSNEVPVHIYKSTNQGDTWVNISGNLPNVPVNDVVVDNVDPARLYAATDLGVYTTRDGGVEWTAFGQGLPFQAVFDLHLHQASRTLFAGTHGRSMWKADLTTLVAVGNGPKTAQLALSAPSPNPSHRSVAFSLSLPGQALARLGVFDASGRRVRSVHDGALAAGRHSFVWDGTDESHRPAPAGVYFVIAETPGAKRSARIVRLGS